MTATAKEEMRNAINRDSYTSGFRIGFSRKFAGMSLTGMLDVGGNTIDKKQSLVLVVVVYSYRKLNMCAGSMDSARMKPRRSSSSHLKQILWPSLPEQHSF